MLKPGGEPGTCRRSSTESSSRVAACGWDRSFDRSRRLARRVVTSSPPPRRVGAAAGAAMSEWVLGAAAGAAMNVWVVGAAAGAAMNVWVVGSAAGGGRAAAEPHDEGREERDLGPHEVTVTVTVVGRRARWRRGGGDAAAAAGLLARALGAVGARLQRRAPARRRRRRRGRVVGRSADRQGHVAADEADAGRGRRSFVAGWEARSVCATR